MSKRQQEKFLDEYIKTGEQTKSYQKVYDCKYDSARANAPRLLAKDSVKSMYREKLKEIRQIDILTVEERQKILANIALADSTRAGDKTKAVDVLNKMDGLYSDAVKADTNININLQGDLKDWSE